MFNRETNIFELLVSVTSFSKVFRFNGTYKQPEDCCFSRYLCHKMALLFSTTIIVTKIDFIGILLFLINYVTENVFLKICLLGWIIQNINNIYIITLSKRSDHFIAVIISQYHSSSPLSLVFQGGVLWPTPSMSMLGGPCLRDGDWGPHGRD